MAEPDYSHQHRPGSLTSPPSRIKTRRQKKKNTDSQPAISRPVRTLRSPPRVVVVVVPSTKKRATKKKAATTPVSAVPESAMAVSRKRTCSDSLGRHQQPEIIPRPRKKTRQSRPLTPAPTSPIHAPNPADVSSSEDEILLRPSTSTAKSHPTTRSLQLPPSPTSSHTDFPVAVRSRAATRSFIRQAEEQETPSTPLKPKQKKKIISQTAPVHRVLPLRSAVDPSVKRTRAQPRHRPLSPSPSSHRSPEKPLPNIGQRGPGSDDDDEPDALVAFDLTLPVKGKLFNSRVVESHSRTPTRKSPRRPGPSSEVPENVEEILSQVENMIPHDTLALENPGSLNARPLEDGPVGVQEDDFVSGVDERCFRVFEDAQRAQGGHHSDGDDDEVSHSGDTEDDRRIVQELSGNARPSCARSPRRLSSVSPLEISAGTRLRRLTTRHAHAPAPLASQNPTPPKEHKVDQPQTAPLPAEKIVEKDAFAAATVLPHLQSLLQHLSGIRPLPIRIPAALGCCPSADGAPRDAAAARIPAILDQTPCLVGLEDLELELRSILFRSIEQQEGNVLLLSGARGSGKTALISRSLALLSDPLTCGSDGFITIKLNGLVHNTDKFALKEMCRQLFSSLAFAKDSDQRRRLDQVNQDLDFRPEDSADEYEYNEDDEDEDGTFQQGGAPRTAAVDQQPKFTNYGEILKNLLDVLEPASSLSSEHEPNTQQRKKTSSGKAVVIVLEEFDLFSDLDRQSFLYCLLDSVQGNKRQNGICVIGTTSVVDCLDKLEKRVKSRCQSRIRYLHSPRTEPERIELVRSLLALPPPPAEKEHHDDSSAAFVDAWNTRLTPFLDHPHTRDWLISRFMLLSDPLVQILQVLNGMVAMIAYSVKRTGQLGFPVLNPSELFGTRGSTRGGQGAAEKPQMVKRSGTQVQMMMMTQPWWASALSTAEVSVLIACKHLSAAHHNGIFNLEMAWDIYRQHLKRQALAADSDPLQNDPRRPALVRSQVYGRDAFELAWERLQRLELILPIEMLTSRGAAAGTKKKKAAAAVLGRRYELVKLVPFVSQIDHVLLGPSSSASAAHRPRLQLAHHLVKWAKNSSD